MNKLLPLIFVTGAMMLQGCSNGGALSPGNSSSSSSDGQSQSSVSSEGGVSSESTSSVSSSSVPTPTSSSTSSSTPGSSSSDPYVPPTSSSTSSVTTSSTPSSTSSVASTSSAPSSTGGSSSDQGPQELTLSGEISESTVLGGPGKDIGEELLNLLGAELFDQFESDLVASGFDMDQLGILFGGLTAMFSTLEASQEELTDLLLVEFGGSASIEGDGFVISSSRDNLSGPTVVIVDFDGSGTAPNCSSDCVVAVDGTLTVNIGSVTESAPYTVFDTLSIVPSSLSLSNGVGELNLDKIALGIGVLGVALDSDPIEVITAAQSGADANVTLLDIEASASNNGIDLDLSVEGTVGDLSASVGNDIEISLTDPSISYNLVATGENIGEGSGSNSSSVSSVESSSSSESSSESSVVSSVSSSSSVVPSSSSSESSSSSSVASSTPPVTVPDGGYVYEIDNDISVAGSTDDLEGLLDLLFDQLGTAATDTYDGMIDAIDSSDFDGNQLGVLFGGLTAMFSTLDATQEQLTDLLLVEFGGSAEIGGNGFSIRSSRDNLSGPTVVVVDFDGTGTAENCSAACDVDVQGTITVNIGSVTESSPYTVFDTLSILPSSLSLSNDLGEMVIDELALEIGVLGVALESDPIEIITAAQSGEDQNVTLLDIKGAASNNGVEISLSVGGAAGDLSASAGNPLEVDLVAPDVSIVVDLTGATGGSSSSAASSSSSSSSSVSSASSSSAPVQAQGDVASGAALYASGSCSGCHGADAQGGAVAPESIAGASTASFRAALSNAFMSSIVLSEQEILDIGAYLESL